MVEIVNLRRARKRRDRADAARDAAENRARFGRTRGERERDALEDAAAARVLDGARLERQPGENPAEKWAKERDTTS